MVEAISAVYDPQIKLSVLRRRQRSGTPIAQWGNVDGIVNLMRPRAQEPDTVLSVEDAAALTDAMQHDDSG
jgi:hypothetical protein